MEDIQPLKLLSLDGGGIRGLSSLIILKHLMRVVNPENPPKPCDYFDLIGGTSTGGLIAIMLGRLQMGVDECINKYLEVSSAAFQRKRSIMDIAGKAKDFMKAEGRYNGDALASEFKKAALAFEGNEDAILLQQDAQCKVFVCAFEKALNTRKLFRSYHTQTTRTSVSPDNYKIWEAARATSAASTYFDSMRIGRQSYVDGATGFNNPIDIVLEEARDIWPDALLRIQSIVSIGTGIPEPQNFGNHVVGVIKTLKAIATETQQTHIRFLTSHIDRGLEGRYFRFNVDKGLLGVGLDDHGKLDVIEAATQQYLEVPGTRSAALSFAAVVPPNLDFIPIGQRDLLLGWLKCSDQRHFYNEASRVRRSNEAGGWFIEGEFKDWRKGPGSLLWLHAKAGSGKTVLTSKIIACIEEQNSDLLAYYYHSFQRREYQTLRDFKTALLVQFVKQLSQKTHEKNSGLIFMPRSFIDLRNKYFPSISPDIRDIDTTLIRIINQSPRTSIVIDALDECEDLQLQSDNLLFAQELLEGVKTDLYILIASRPEVDIKTGVDQMPIAKRQVAFHPMKINSDIRSYLVSVTNEVHYSRWPDSLRDHVVDYITDRSDGVFRWADLQIQSLRGKSREIDVTSALETLPKNLSESYKRILDGIISPVEKRLAVTVLRWLSYSQSQLSVKELAELAGLHFQTESSEYLSPGSDEYLVTFRPQDRYNNPEDILRILPGLLTVTDTNDPETWPFISFSHFTVREYLGSDEAPALFKICAEDCNWFIFKSCLAYIGDYDSHNFDDPLKETHPLILYACLHIWYHAEELLCCSKAEVDREHVRTSLLKSLHSRNYKPGYAFNLALQRAGISVPDSSVALGSLVRDVSLTTIGDFYGFHDELINESIRTADVELFEFTNHARVYMCDGLSEITEAWYGKRSTLATATRSTPPKFKYISTILTDVFSKESARDTHLAFHMANPSTPDDNLDRKSRSFWNILLMHPDIHINQTNRSDQTLLLIAALHGDFNMSDYLLGVKGVDRDVRAKHGWGLAACAAIGGHQDLIKLVFSMPGIDLTSVDRYGWTPRTWATYRGFQNLVAPYAHVEYQSPETFVRFKELEKHSFALERGERITSVFFSQNGLYLAIVLSWTTCSIYDASSMALITSLEDDEDWESIQEISWSHNNMLILTWVPYGCPKLFSTKSGDLVATFDLRALSCAWFPNGNSLVLASALDAGCLHHFEIKLQGKEADDGLELSEISRNHAPRHIRDVAVSPDGRFFVAITHWFRQNNLYVYRINTRSLEYRYYVNMNEHRLKSIGPLAIAIDNKSQWIVLRADNGGQKLIDITNGSILNDDPPLIDYAQGLNRWVLGGPNGTWLVNSEYDGYISIRDCESGRVIGYSLGHFPYTITSISRRPGNEDIFASCADHDNEVRIWSLSEFTMYDGVSMPVQQPGVILQENALPSSQVAGDEDEKSCVT